MGLQVGLDKSWQTKVYEAFARKSPAVIKLFHLFYYLLIVFWAFGAYATLAKSPLQPFFYQFGKHSGQSALVLLGIVVLPGILGRLNIQIKLTRIITLFRRQLGITVFIFAYIHYSFIRGIPYISTLIPFKLSFPMFEIMGMAAISLLFLMFITSNNFSQKKLGRGWKKLHRIVYIVLWLLVLHTGLQRISIWSIFIFSFALIETLSWIYYTFRKPPVNV